MKTRKARAIEVYPIPTSTTMTAAEIALGTMKRYKEWHLVPATNVVFLAEPVVLLVSEFDVPSPSDGVVCVRVQVYTPHRQDGIVVFEGAVHCKNEGYSFVYLIQQQGWLHRIVT